MQAFKRMTLDVNGVSETYVLIPEAQYHEKQDNVDNDGFKNLKWALQATGLSRNTLIPKLYHYQKQLDIDSGGCVSFSGISGVRWKFEPNEFLEFIHRHKKEFTKAGN